MDVTRIYRRDIIRGVLERFKDQYSHYNYYSEIGSGSTLEAVGLKIARLSKLDLETASCEDVDKAMNLTGWVDLNCEFCDANVESLTRLGNEPDYEARWVDICDECLGKIVENNRHTN